MRYAEEADIPRIVEMGEGFHRFAQLPWVYNKAATADAVRGMMDQGCVLVTDGGAIGGVIGSAWSSPDWKYACELFWWSEDGSGLRLLRGFEEWASEMGANEVRMTTLSHFPGAERALSRRGYVVNELSHGKVI